MRNAKSGGFFCIRLHTLFASCLFGNGNDEIRICRKMLIFQDIVMNTQAKCRGRVIACSSQALGVITNKELWSHKSSICAHDNLSVICDQLFTI